MPTEQDIAKAYKNYYTHGLIPPDQHTWRYRAREWLARGYAASAYGYTSSASLIQRLAGFMAFVHPGLRAEFEKRILYLPARLRGRLLDVGCGSGEALAEMAATGWDATGVDVDPVAIEQAKAKGLKVTLGSLNQLEFPDEHFNAVTMNHVIEHVHRPLELLRECKRILAPGGHLVVMTPNIESWGHRRFRVCWFPLDPPRHLWLFSRQTLRTLAERAGFRNPNVRTTIHHAHRQFVASMFIKRSGHVLHRPTNALRLWGQMMELAEWGLLTVRRDAGEEILLRAKKEEP